MIYNMWARMYNMIYCLEGMDALYDIRYGGRNVLYDIIYGGKHVLYDILVGEKDVQ